MTQQFRTEYRPSDPDFGTPFIDVDEWREKPRRHRYVHGGFEGTHTLFSFYFPPPELYRGRLFQYLEGGAGGHENLLATGMYGGTDWIFNLAFEELGGVLVESNQGHYHNEGLGFANDIELFRASAESARFARRLAAEMYGSAPHHAYVWGGSGGGSRSIYCLENAPDVYAGAAPHVVWPTTRGSTGGAHPWSAWANWWLNARHKRGTIMDATEPGGSGDPFAGLSTDEREALSALYRRGYPRGAESQLWSFGPWLFQMYGVKSSDPAYYEDFWTVPGYLGADAPERLQPLVVNERFKVRKVLRADDGAFVVAGIARAATAGAVSTGPTSPGGEPIGLNYAIELDAALDDPQRLCFAKVTVLTGKAKGREVYIAQVEGETLFGFGEMAPQLFDGVAPGDEVQVDNRDFIAFAYLYRYAIDVEGYSIHDAATGREQFAPEHGGLRGECVDHRPIYPQRPAPVQNRRDHSGRFTGKMIQVLATHDSMCWPGPSAFYARKVRSHLGDRMDEQYRLWWVENAPHGAPEWLRPAVTPEKDPGVWRSRLVDYNGVTAEALRQLVAWVEEGVPPAASTAYDLTEDGGLLLPPTAARRGVQPVVTLTANGGVRAEVRVGEPVRFVGVAEQPPGTGVIVAAEWDFEGTGAFVAAPVDGGGEAVTLEASHTYTRPGTYFASFRVGAHRDGARGRGPLIRNLARVRVVVSAD
jgi:hypothetical protein